MTETILKIDLILFVTLNFIRIFLIVWLVLMNYLYEWFD